MEWLVGLIVGITALIVALGNLIKAISDAKKKVEESIPHKIKKQVTLTEEISSRMDMIKEYIGADRVQIYDFHNGGHYANGRSALKTSCTFESVRAGIKPMQTILQAVPLSCIAKYISNLLNAGGVEVKDITDIRTTMPGAYGWKYAQNVKSFYDIILTNKESEPIGFLEVQFCNSNEHELDEKMKHELLRLKFFIEENLQKML